MKYLSCSCIKNGDLQYFPSIFTLVVKHQVSVFSLSATVWTAAWCFKLIPTLLGPGAGGFPGEWRVGMTGAARGVWAGVLGSLLLISPAEAEADPDAAPFPPVPAGRLGCWRNPGRRIHEKKSYRPIRNLDYKRTTRSLWVYCFLMMAIKEVPHWICLHAHVHIVSWFWPFSGWRLHWKFTLRSQFVFYFCIYDQCLQMCFWSLNISANRSFL